LRLFVHKFGGASLKDAASIKNVANIIQQQSTPSIIVISAIGKTTNDLENVVKSAFFKSNPPEQYLESIKTQHQGIIHSLFHSISSQKEEDVQQLINTHWAYVEQLIRQDVIYPYGQFYDQIVSVGELVSSTIVSEYLNAIGCYSTWLDVRQVLLTDQQWRAANIDWTNSLRRFEEIVRPFLSDTARIVTQGFIGGTSHGFTTTLGREGSDYTAAIMAYFADAESVTIWKDVEGVLNADPRYFKNPQKIDELSYYDAIEMTYYGATVIHPKTIKPLQNKSIPLKVKSFIHPEAPGTLIHQPQQTKRITTYSYLPNQVLITLQSQDFSFFAEPQIQQCFQVINNYGLKINLMQNTALNFSICITYDEVIFKNFISELQKHFKVLFNQNVAILTIRHYVPNTLSSLLEGKEVLLEQRTRHHLQFVLRGK